MANQLQIYNDALLLLGARQLASLTEQREERRVLDTIYAGGLDRWLEEGLWNFAMRTTERSSDGTPSFGFQYQFNKPSDWIRTQTVSASQRLDVPLLEYGDERGFWGADVDPIYVRYVSNGTAYGGNLSRWGQSFANYVAHDIAMRAAPRVFGAAAGSRLLQGPYGLTEATKKALANARTKDALNEAPAFPPQVSWVTARRNGWSRRSRSSENG